MVMVCLKGVRLHLLSKYGAWFLIVIKRKFFTLPSQLQISGLGIDRDKVKLGCMPVASCIRYIQW